MQAFDRLLPAFSAHELRSLWETMVERGLRIRKGLEEVMEEWDVEKTSRTEAWDEADEGRDGELDEIEYDAQELARLKPY